MTWKFPQLGEISKSLHSVLTDHSMVLTVASKMIQKVILK